MAMYVDYMNGAQVLEQWLQVEYEKDVAEFKGFPDQMGADICMGCKTYYGQTVGGRLRFGCPACCSKWPNSILGASVHNRLCMGDYAVARLTVITGYTGPQVKYLLANCGWEDVQIQRAIAQEF